MAEAKPDMRECSAIVGMACRVAGAANPSELWDNVINQVDLRRPIPKDRFSVEGFYNPNGSNKGTTSIKYGYFIDQPIDVFDPTFFGISGKEVESMDPQQRLILEVVYEALEDAGITLQEISGTRTAVFVGSFTNDYALMTARDMDDYPKYSVNGLSNAVISNRVSFFYNLHGPSVTIDTACSASLVAFHLGNQSLLTEESDYAIVVGSALNFIPNTWQIMTDLGLLSTDGRCRAFDADGKGYVRGEGVCAVVLKRASDAKRNGDQIRAIVRASATNHDGTKSALGLPSAESQERLIRMTYEKARLNPDDTQFFEAHGTGTKVGDPLEAKAIGAVFGTPTRKKNLMIGSIKTNIGHLEGAAGLIGVIKATLALEKRQIPPNMLFNRPNPDIRFDDWKLTVPTTAQDWLVQGSGPFRASVNSFGYGGANAHVILERYQGDVTNMPTTVNDHHTPTAIDTRPYLCPLTAHSGTSGDLLRAALADYLMRTPRISIKDLAYSLVHRRTMHRTRSWVVGSTPESVIQQFQESPPVSPWNNSGTVQRIGFVFTGQGAQSFQMGQQLIAHSPLFRASLAKADYVLQSLPKSDRPSWSIFGELLRDEESCRFDRSEYSQPVCTALQLALVDLLAAWGIRPAAVCGHSSGEIAAAYAAGMMTFEAAIVSAFYRGYCASRRRTPHNAVPGAMMAVGMTEEDMQSALAPFDGRLVIAAVNSSRSITISGDANAVEELASSLPSKIFARRLHVEQAYHSNHMKPLASSHKRALDACPLFQVTGRGQACPMFSSVTRKRVHPRQLTSAYWAENMVRTVYFADAVASVLLGSDESGVPPVDLLLEIGPHPALRGPTKQVMADLKINVPYVGTLDRTKPAFQSLLEGAGQLFAAGYPVDLLAANFEGQGEGDRASCESPAKRLRDLPTYPWDHKPFWFATRLVKEHLHRPARHTILGTAVPGSIATHPRWKSTLRLSEVPWLRDHVFDGKALFPGAGFLSMAIEAVLRINPDMDRHSVSLIRAKNANIKAPLLLSDTDRGSEVYIELSPTKLSAKTVSDEWFDFAVSSYDETGRFSSNCTGMVSLEHGDPAPLRLAIREHPSLDVLRRGASRRVRPEVFYNQVNECGLYLGERFRLFNSPIYCGSEFVTSGVSFRPDMYSSHELSEGTALHPTLLDTCFQSTFYGIESQIGRKLDSVFVPTFIKSFSMSGQFLIWDMLGQPSSFSTSTSVAVLTDRSAVSHVQLHDSGNKSLVLDIQGLEMTTLGRTNLLLRDRSLCLRQKFKPCFDHLDSDTSGILRSTSFDRILELFQFQHPTARVLVKSSKPELTVPILQQLVGPADRRRMYQAIHITPTAEEGNEWSTALCNAGDGDIFMTDPEGTYDLIVWHDAETPLNEISPFMSSGCVLVTSDTDSLDSPSDWQALFSSKEGCIYHRQPTLPAAIADVVAIVHGSESSGHMSTAVLEALNSLCRVASISLSSAAETDFSTQPVVVVLAMLENVIESERDWKGVRNLLGQENKSIVWLLSGATMDSTSPEQAKIWGLIKVARNENPQARLVVVDIEPATTADRAAKLILQSHTDAAAGEEDLVDRDGCVYIPRIIEDYALNNTLPAAPGDGATAHQRRFGNEPALALRIGKVGLLETLHFSPDEPILAKSDLAADDVEIRVAASALNFRDIAAAMGIVSGGAPLGDECAGTVVRTGAAVSPDQFRAGDRVVACRPGQGAHSTFVRQPASLCCKIPDTFAAADPTMARAASWSAALTTAVYSLLDVARLRKGETVLIHSATGGVGQMAVQVARMVGARVLATCSPGPSPEAKKKHALLQDVYGITPADIFSSRDESFVDGVLAATGGRGADVVLNSLAGPLLRASWRCIAPFGRFVEIGKRDIDQDALLEMAPFRRNVVFAAVDLVMVFEQNPALAERILRESAELFFSGTIKSPVGLQEFPYSQAEKAFRLLQQGKHIGKVVLISDDEDLVPVINSSPQTRNKRLFDASKTYLLVGGLGGLGTVLTEWMVSHGAMKLAFLSRSGADKGYAKETVEWLQSKGVEIRVFRGDVADKQTVEDCILTIGPTLRGLFHAAGSLDDTLIRNMTFSQWEAPLRAKCDGARNLHDATLRHSTNLDFFICLSSSSAITGNMGQGNYSAANAYLDALASHRHRLGLTGSTMNVGAVDGFGALSDRNLRATVLRMGHDLISEQEFLLQVEETVLAALHRRGDQFGDAHQLITGVNVADPDVFWAQRSCFKNLYANRERGVGLSSATHSDGSRSSIAARLAAAATSEARHAVLLQAFLDKVAAVLSVPRDNISAANPLAAYGLDSIVAVEFRQWFKETAGADVTLFDIMGAGSIKALVLKATEGLEGSVVKD